MRNIKWYGWRPDTPDQRDFKFSARPQVIKNLPKHTDLSSLILEVYDQDNLGACTANAIEAAMRYSRKKQKLDDLQLSRLFIYFGEREMEGTISEDSGAEIRSGIKFINKSGACKESLWPYKINRFAKRPNLECYADALNHKLVEYRSVSQTLTQMKGCLAQGFPFVFGFTAYEYFESEKFAASGKLYMPTRSEGVVGGHAVVCVGYDDRTKRFLVLNSWGRGFGKNGFYTMPYPYLENPDLAADFWMLTMVS